MIKTARQLKDLIRNLSREKSADAQLLMRNYMMERFLERISLSEYRDKFILKGGMLVAAMVGLDARSTMDLDATVKGANVNVEDIENLISAIVSVPIDDGVKFQLKSISEIMDEAEYPGIRVSMTTTFDGVVTPLKIDISTGDAITPREVRYSFKLMLEDRSIDIWAYNLETVLAEKLETIITRTTTNTRMRDFYDLHILSQLHGQSIIPADLRAALIATAKKRGTEKYLADAPAAFDEVEADPNMEKLWRAYQKMPKFLRKWKTARLCRNFGNLTAGSFPMRQIWSGASSWGRFAVYTLYVKRDRAYEKTRSLLQSLRRIQSQRKIFRQRPCGSYL